MSDKILLKQDPSVNGPPELQQDSEGAERSKHTGTYKSKHRRCSFSPVLVGENNLIYSYLLIPPHDGKLDIFLLSVDDLWTYFQIFHHQSQWLFILLISSF